MSDLWDNPPISSRETLHGFQDQEDIVFFRCSSHPDGSRMAGRHPVRPAHNRSKRRRAGVRHNIPSGISSPRSPSGYQHCHRCPRHRQVLPDCRASLRYPARTSGKHPFRPCRNCCPFSRMEHPGHAPNAETHLDDIRLSVGLFCWAGMFHRPCSGNRQPGTRNGLQKSSPFHLKYQTFHLHSGYLS
jgi:hypothetical protein